MQTKFLTYSDVEREYAIKKNTLYALVSQGRIPHVRLGRRFVRFDPEALRTFFQSQAVPAGSHKKPVTTAE